MSDVPQKNSPSPEDHGGDPLSYFHQKKVVVPTAVIGLLLTVLTWFIPAASVFTFIPPFLGVYALGHLLFPKLEEGPDIKSGFMSGFYYREKSARRWHIIVVSAFAAAINYYVVYFLWLE